MIRGHPRSPLFPYPPLFRSALVRKIFPNPGETRDWVRWYVPSADDFAAGERFLTLANGSRAVLCVCYDAFGSPRLATLCVGRSEEHTSELHSHLNLVSRLLL